MEDWVMIHEAFARPAKPIRPTASRCFLPWPGESCLKLDPLLTISH